MTISQRIFYLLDAKNKKQNELSLFIGVSTSTVSAWGKRGTDPPANLITKIAEFFEVSVIYLLTGIEENDSNIAKSNISNSIVDHSNGVININGTSNFTSQSDTSEKQGLSENDEELLKIFHSLPTRERIKLLNVIYDFEEQYRKLNT